MMTYMMWATGLSFFYLTIMALVTQTKNFTSSLLFKVIPFFIGLLNLVVFLKVLGIV